MIEGINITYFVIFSILLYLYLLLFGAVNINSYAGCLYAKLKANINVLVGKNNTVQNIFNTTRIKIFPFIAISFSTSIKYLHAFSIYLDRFDIALKIKVVDYLDEPVDYLALILRKLYDGSPRIWLVYSSLVIVVFYFILTVF
jgi:hypothetical protein